MMMNQMNSYANGLVEMTYYHVLPVLDDDSHVLYRALSTATVILLDQVAVVVMQQGDYLSSNFVLILLYVTHYMV
jgi:hypothetical protein